MTLKTVHARPQELPASLRVARTHPSIAEAFRGPEYAAAVVRFRRARSRLDLACWIASAGIALATAACVYWK